MAREMKNVLTGIVVSNKMDKTVVVRVARTYRHPLYGKVVKVHKKYHAHDENNSCQEGDEVRILETRPLSKTKRWVVIENLTQSASENA
jgi:small subunit ribosomal protein S17